MHCQWGERKKWDFTANDLYEEDECRIEPIDVDIFKVKKKKLRLHIYLRFFGGLCLEETHLNKFLYRKNPKCFSALCAKVEDLPVYSLCPCFCNDKLYHLKS
jgi:hypothetical protein